MKLKYMYSFKILNDDFLVSETQQLIILKLLHHLYIVSLLYTTIISIISEYSCWSLARVCVLLHAMPIN